MHSLALAVMLAALAEVSAPNRTLQQREGEKEPEHHASSLVKKKEEEDLSLVSKYLLTY